MTNGWRDNENAWVSLAAVCALVIGVYACLARSGVWELVSRNASETYYNLLVQGLRAGQLSLKKDVPPGLVQLADPYDPTANVVFRRGASRLEDLSYYKGRLYLYFGITPALILFWPFVALTGHYLFHGQAATIFCAVGFLASAGMLGALWRRYFSEVSIWVVGACAVALGLASGVPVMLPRSSVYEVAISCAYMLAMLALGAIWCALHETDRRGRWLAAASLAYGLAVGARPSLLFGGIILLVPVVQAWCERRKIRALLAAAIVPIALIGLGLMLYNALRFDNPFEFGSRYQLGVGQTTAQLFSPRYLWFNFRVYFLKPAHWSGRFPFVEGIAVPPFPVGYARVEDPFGVLTNVPLVWLALAVPLAWRNRSREAASILRWSVTAAALLFGIGTLTMSLFWAACIRYEVDFLPALLLLAVVGILGLERALMSRPVWRLAARWSWGLLLGFSVAFNLFAGVDRCAGSYNNLGIALYQTGNREEAVEQYEQALLMKPDYSEAHVNLGNALLQEGKISDAIGHYEQALRIKPADAGAHYNLGVALGQAGRTPQAIEQLQQALRIKPDFTQAQAALARLQAGSPAFRP